MEIPAVVITILVFLICFLFSYIDLRKKEIDRLKKQNDNKDLEIDALKRRNQFLYNSIAAKRNEIDILQAQLEVEIKKGLEFAHKLQKEFNRLKKLKGKKNEKRKSKVSSRKRKS